MDFDLTESQQRVRDDIRAFAESRIRPLARQIDSDGKVPMDVIRELGARRYMAMMIPVDYGGAGLDTTSYSIVVEEVSRACASTGVCVSVNNSLFADGLYKFGSEALKRRYLPKMGDGRMNGCLALTEMEAGTDLAAAKTTAIPDGDDYILNGSKLFITNGGFSDATLALVSTDLLAGSRGLSVVVVDKGTPGFRVGRREETMGIRGSDTSELIFENCRIPRANRLGDEGDGFRIGLTILDGGRIGIASQAVGIAQAAYEEAVAYARTRQQFGRPIGTFQAIAFKLADMATEIDAARLLTLRAAWLKDRKQPYGTAAAMAKLYASEMAIRVTNEALQIHGGAGYVRHPQNNIERYYRDARITAIYEGTSEAQRIVVSRNILKGQEGEG